MTLRHLLPAFVAALALLGLARPAYAIAYYGSLQYTPPPPPGSLDGLYVGPSGLQWETYTVAIEWWVTNEDLSQPGYPWKYTYRFGHNGSQAAISHIIIEASEGMLAGDMTGLSGATVDSMALQFAGPGNPSMPEDVYGIKFNPPSDGLFDMTWSFFSNREPVWGDFYAKCGGGLGGINYAYNYNYTDPGGPALGFLDPNNDNTVRDDPDPSGPPGNGSLQFHILRPNSYAQEAIPEPGTAAVLALGLAALARARRRSRQQ